MLLAYTLNFNQFSKFLLKSLFLLSALIYLLLSIHLPVSLPVYNLHDDALYWNNAQQILQGQWLGAYNEMTLMKGPGFPLFLVVNALLGIPATLSIALFYLLACYLVTNTFRELGISKYFLLVIFIVILFHPFFTTRIMRDCIYPALSLIVLSGVIKLTLTPVEQKCGIKYPIFYGLVLGFFWITREEGVWIIPSFSLLIIYKIWHLKKQKKTIKSIFYRYTYFLVSALILVNTVAVINFYTYGKYEVVDFKGTEFKQAVSSLNSVSIGKEIAYLPVSFAKRQVIYQISPSFTELKDYFENTGKGWTQFGCQFYPHTCGDYAGGFFWWALREAVASKGYYKNPIMAAEFYKKISTEIEIACDTGRIVCKKPLITFLPNIPAGQLKLIPEKFIDGLKLLMLFNPVSDFIVPDNSHEPSAELRKVWQFLGYPYALPISHSSTITLNGWFIGSDIKNWITLDCLDFDISTNIIPKKVSSPDLATINEKANHQRFSINILNKKNCKISTLFSKDDSISINLINKDNLSFKLGNGDLHIDHVEQTDSYNFTNKASVEFKSILMKIYGFVMPKLTIFAAISYLYFLIVILLEKKQISDVFVVSTILWCLVFSRIMILVLLDISLFPSLIPEYMAPAFPILCLASFTSLQLSFTMFSSYLFRICKSRN